MRFISPHKIPHEGPLDAPLFFLGESPGSTEDELRRPFVGKSGDLLDIALETYGLSRSDVRLGYVMNYNIIKNDFQKARASEQLHESMTELRAYLNNAQHKVIVAMGSAALEFLTGHTYAEKHRGSVYRYENFYVVPTISPDIVRINGAHSPGFLHDIGKAIEIAKTGIWEEYSFNALIDPDLFQLEGLKDTICNASHLEVDIESKRDTTYIRCIGFAWSDKDAVCIYNDAPYVDGQSPIGPVFRRYVDMFLRCDAEKTFHNGMFDSIMLEANGFEIHNWAYDTMVAQHVLQPELPIGLDYCTSIYTNLNYYKDDGKESGDRIDRRKLGLYNCKDVIATRLTRLAQQNEFDDVTRRYFEYKMKQIPVAKHFSLTGMYVDEERREELRTKISDAREKDMVMFLGIQQLIGVPEPFKVTQHQKVKDFLYGTLELPKKMNSDGDLTADEDAIVSLIATVQKKLQDLKTATARQMWEIRLATLKLLLRIRGQEKLLSSYINIELSMDGRARSWYKFWGTETGRWSAGSWHDGTGLNGQTIPRESV